MTEITRLFASNRRWVATMTQTDPEFFRKRAVPAEPHFLFIGCSDSRVPAFQLTEHAQARWLHPNEFASVPWAPADEPILAELSALKA